jgi:hypothetical protein
MRREKPKKKKSPPELSVPTCILIPSGIVIPEVLSSRSEARDLGSSPAPSNKLQASSATAIDYCPVNKKIGVCNGAKGTAVPESLVIDTLE